MEERRKMRRFDLRLPCLIGPFSESGGQNEWMTQNISSGGAYILSGQVYPVGTRLEVRILIRRNGQTAPPQNSSYVCIWGEVIRTDTAGAALEFDDDYQIAKIRNIFQQSNAFSSELAPEFSTGRSHIAQIKKPVGAKVLHVSTTHRFDSRGDAPCERLS